MSSNKFISFLEQAGKDFEKGFLTVLHIAQTTGAAAVAVFAPELGPIFNSTVAAVTLVEQKYAAIGKQSGSGASKLADVLTVSEPVIAQGLAAAGKQSDTAAVTAYINAVVQVLNSIPAAPPS